MIIVYIHVHLHFPSRKIINEMLLTACISLLSSLLFFLFSIIDSDLDVSVWIDITSQCLQEDKRDLFSNTSNSFLYLGSKIYYYMYRTTGGKKKRAYQCTKRI